MKCGGHVGRSHANALKELKAKKEFDSGYISKHRSNFPEVAKIICCCKGKGTLHTVVASVTVSLNPPVAICSVQLRNVATMQQVLHDA